jgi:hypothetical protein
MLPPHPNSPCTHPAWRHLRAIHLVAEGGRADHPRDDDMSRDVWRFYRALHGCASENRRKTLARTMPAHFEAYTIFATTDPFTRAELEARLLAGQDDCAIAARCGLSPSAVGVYHDAYFAVRPRLGCEGYILNVVLGSRLHGGLTEKDRDVILALAAYQLGPVALDALLAHYTQPPLALNALKRLDAHALLALGDRLRCQALVHALTMTSDKRSLRTAALLQNLLGRLRAAEEASGQTATAVRGPGETDPGHRDARAVVGEVRAAAALAG